MNMKCPECNSTTISNENTGQPRGLRRRGGVFHNTCHKCGCEFTWEAGDSRITKHGNTVKSEKHPKISRKKDGKVLPKGIYS